MRIKEICLNTQDILNELVIYFELQGLNHKEVAEEFKSLEEECMLSEALDQIEFTIVSDMIDNAEEFDYDDLETEQDVLTYINNKLNGEAILFQIEEDTAVVYYHTTLFALLNQLKR